MKKSPIKRSKSIGIIGAGLAGGTLKRYWAEAKIYDTREGQWDSLKSVLRQEYVFITVDFSDRCLSIGSRGIMASYLEEIPDGRKIIMQSAFVPGTTEYFESKYGNLSFCYNPEFLDPQTAWEDFINPQFQILGLSRKSSHLENEFFDLLPQSKNNIVLAPREAEMLKINDMVK